MHDLSVIATLAGGLACALVFGWFTRRLGLSTLVGFMLAGIAVGPHTPGFIADAYLATQMAEIGVILLMFGVGMHFHPQELLRVWRIAVPGAVGQSAVAAVAGWGVARAFGWSHAAGIVFGMALAVASTVVLMRMLVEQDRLSTRDGHVAVGWLIVEDLFTVLALVVLPALAGDVTDSASLATTLAVALGKAALFAVLIWALGGRFVQPLMERIARTRSAELFTLTVFVVALGVAVVAAEVFHVSVALGAFFAGLVVGQSRFGTQAAADMAPFRDVFSALFFVSVGMLFNPRFVFAQPLLALAVIAIVLVLKPLAALIIVRVLRGARTTALTVAVGLSQIGEFSFVLASLGKMLGILPDTAIDALVVAAIVSIAVNPLLFRWLAAYEAKHLAARDEGSLTRSAEEPVTLEGNYAVVLAGTDELGRRVLRRCAEGGASVSAIDARLDRLDDLRDAGLHTVFGDPARGDVLEAAGLASARVLVVTDGALTEKMRICVAARQINPRIAIVTTAASPAEHAWLQEFGAVFVHDVLDEATEAVVRSIRSAL